jgi:hypothetical protein
MDALRDNQNSTGPIIDRRIAALSIRPSPSVRSPRAIGENHFARLRGFRFTGKSHVVLGSGRISDFDVFRDLRNIEDGYRDGERYGDRIADIDQGMDLR